MDMQMQAAVTYVRHLCQQGLDAIGALDHAVQRFGVDRQALRKALWLP